MILTPVYCSSEPPPASGPVKSKITPILIFFSCAVADPAMPSADIAASTIAANGRPNSRAALRSDMKPSLEDDVTGLFLLAPITLIVRSDVKRIGKAAPRPRPP
jgi:hypothetical protein